LRFWVGGQALERDQQVSRGDEGDVVVPAQPGAPFEVIQAEAVLEFAVFVLDPPAHLPEPDQPNQVLLEVVFSRGAALVLPVIEASHLEAVELLANSRAGRFVFGDEGDAESLQCSTKAPLGVAVEGDAAVLEVANLLGGELGRIGDGIGGNLGESAGRTGEVRTKERN